MQPMTPMTLSMSLRLYMCSRAFSRLQPPPAWSWVTQSLAWASLQQVSHLTGHGHSDVRHATYRPPKDTRSVDDYLITGVTNMPVYILTFITFKLKIKTGYNSCAYINGL